jgi:Helix-destabilising protein
MIVIYVFPQVHEKPLTRKSDGKEFKLRFQEAEVRRDRRRPRVLEIPIRDDAPPYAEGLHTIGAESFRPDQYDRLEMRYLSLIPLDEAIQIAEKARKSFKAEKLV